MKAPETHYVRTEDGVDIAYSVVGDGPIDVVVVPQFISHIEFEWEHPGCRSFYERIGSFARVIRFDKRGAGLSDRIGDKAPTVDQRLEDIQAVMRATGAEQPCVLGCSEGGTISAVFAATYPQQVRALIMCASPVRSMWDESFPIGLPVAFYEPLTKALFENWGTGVVGPTMEAAASTDPSKKDWWARLERLAGTPNSVEAVWRMSADLDIRPVLPLISAPTLLIYRVSDLWNEQGRYAAKLMPSAKIVQPPGSDHLPWAGDWEPIADEIEEFLTGRHAAPRVDRALATVLFTDVVQSTSKTAALGDRRWRSLLDSFDERTSQEVTNWNGQVVKNTGDGHLATFTGPTSAIRCASAIREAVRSLGVEVRSGLHSGEIEFRGKDVSGIAVNIASRVSALASGDEILVSRTVTDLVAGSGLEFDDRGEHELKGVPGRWQIYAVKN